MADRKRSAGSGKDVFVSYDRTRVAEDFVVRLKRDLDKEGFTTFLDVKDIPPGCNWVEGIGRGLQSSACLVAVVTGAYVASSYCSSELFVADADRKPVFPVILEDVDFEQSEKSVGVKWVISGLGWTFFRPEVDNYSSSLSKLMLGMSRHGIGANASGDANISLANGMSRLSISPGRHGPSSTPCDKQTSSSVLDPEQPNAGNPLSSSHPPHLPQLATQPLEPKAPPTTPQRPLSTPFESGVTPAQNGPLQPCATPPRLPYHPGFSPQYPFPGYTPPPGYAVPYTTDSINPVPLSEEDLEAQAQEHLSAAIAQAPPKILPKDRFRVGLKLEAVDRRFPYYVCVATIQDKKDNGKVLIHFDGWGRDYDYWCDSDDIELHPVGWCSQHKYELYPTRGIQWHGWNKYLSSTHSEAADSSYFNEVQLAVPGSLLFRPGMRLEVKDPKPARKFHVATVKKVADEQILVHFDGWDSKSDFWCSPDSPDIHPPMWCGKHNKKVNPPKGHAGPFRWSHYLADPEINPVPAHCFTKEQLGDERERREQPVAAVAGVGGGLFEVGMKLEAKDRKHPELVCVATITDIRGSQLLIHFDGWTNYYDYWCESDSTDVHPIGWCEEQGRTVLDPKGFVGEFSWDKYLHDSYAVAAPEDAFTDEQKN